MTETTPDGLPGRRHASRRWYALAVISAAFFMGVLDSTSVYAGLPSIAEDLAFSAAGIQWVLTAYGVAFGGLLLLGGRVADLMGRRRVLMIAVALFATASLFCGLAWSSEVLITARAAQGVGAAIMTPAGLSILMTIFPDGRDRNRALGVWGGLGGIGATAGLLLGGVLTDGLGWEWIFFTNVPVCLAVLVLSPVLLPESRHRGQRPNLDLAGALTVTAALVFLLAGLFTVADVGWPAPLPIGLVTAAVVLGAVFVLIESRSAAPLVPLRIFRSRTLVGGNIVVLVAGIAVDGLLIIVTLYAQQVLGYSAIQFGLAMAVMTVMAIVGVAAGQHVVTRVGFRLVAATGMVLLGVAALILTRISLDGTFVDDLLLGLLIFGTGMGASFVAAQIAALTGISEHESGLASGVEETSFVVGSTLGIAVVTAVAVSQTNHLIAGGTPAVLARVEGFQVALAVVAGFAVLGLLAAITLLGQPHEQRHRVFGSQK